MSAIFPDMINFVRLLTVSLAALLFIYPLSAVSEETTYYFRFKSPNGAWTQWQKRVVPVELIDPPRGASTNSQDETIRAGDQRQFWRTLTIDNRTFRIQRLLTYLSHEIGYPYEFWWLEALIGLLSSMYWSTEYHCKPPYPAYVHNLPAITTPGGYQIQPVFGIYGASEGLDLEKHAFISEAFPGYYGHQSIDPDNDLVTINAEMLPLDNSELEAPSCSTDIIIEIYGWTVVGMQGTAPTGEEFQLIHTQSAPAAASTEGQPAEEAPSSSPQAPDEDPAPEQTQQTDLQLQEAVKLLVQTVLTTALSNAKTALK
ncbi:MAG: hypothetical protein ACR2PT_01495 [Endozoicomonas sp.]